jgi:glycosyltransferase involved in cell wall biosynthesis
MCEEFSRLGLEVELIVPKRKNYIKEDVFKYYSLRKNFKVNYLKVFDFLPFDKFLLKKAFYLNSFLFLMRSFFLKINKKAILYTRSPEIAWLFKLRGYKIFFEAHTYPESKNFIFKLFLKNIKIISITHGLKKVFVKNGFDEKNILVASDAVDLDKLNIDVSKKEARKKLDLPLDKKIIMYTGSFSVWGWKGIDLILDISKKFNKDFLFVLVGGNKKEVDVLNNKFKDSNLIAIEKVLHKKIPFYLKSADLLLLPNKKGDVISEKYTSPLKLFEYMASGNPIIASNLSSIREIIGEENAFLFKPNDREDLVLRIKEVFENKEEAIKRAGKAFLDVKKYTWKKRAENIINFIRK